MELSWDCLFVLFWAQIFANTTCSKLIALCFFRRCVINVLILHSSLGSERGLRRKSSWEKGLCLPGKGFSKCLDPCDHEGIYKWLISTMPSPEPAPQPPLNSSWTLMNSLCCSKGWRQRRKSLSWGHAVHLQQSMQNLTLPQLTSPCLPSRAHLHHLMGSSWLCPCQPVAGFKDKVQPGSLGWHAEFNPELPWWHRHTQKSCLCLNCSSVEWTSKSTAPYPPSTARLKTNA